ncbi:MAG: YraN family protein [Fusobacteriaceae bacterium]|nr:YraN family protein [Fusobacteriaceae bacterium]
MNKREMGSIYEERAVKFLEDNNCSIVDTNYRCKRGEIDIICLDRTELVFVEVKYRKTNEYGEGIESVDKNKIRKIYRTAEEYLFRFNVKNYSFRFDCISFLNNETKWIKNIIWGDEIGF